MSAQSAAPTSVPPGAIRVLLADDHRVTLWGLQQLVDSSRPHLCVVGTATSRDELLAHPALPEADVVLLDLDLGGYNGADAIADLAARSKAQVLILTAEEDTTVHRDVVVKGARGVLHKSASADLVLRAIEKVAAGEIWLDSKLMGEVMGRLTGRISASAQPDANMARAASLTPREREIVITLSCMPGAKQLAVADELGMSEHTLRNHLTTIYSKLGVRGRLEMHVWAVEHGLVAARQNKI
jgi:two-component system, NarL family, nitrate/nitrite response regulator NarL